MGDVTHKQALDTVYEYIEEADLPNLAEVVAKEVMAERGEQHPTLTAQELILIADAAEAGAIKATSRYLHGLALKLDLLL